MFVRKAGCVIAAAFVVLMASAPLGPTLAQTQAPSGASLLLAKELVGLKKSQFSVYETVVPGVIEQAKSVFLQTNPALSKELEDVATKLRADYSDRTTELSDIIAGLYVQQFTEQDLKDILAFYRSPVGAKLLAKEPAVVDQSLGQIQQWANKLSQEIINRMRAEMKRKGYDL